MRRMTPGDVDAARTMASSALAGGPEERERMIGHTAEERTRRRARFLHLLSTDGPGAWVAVDGERIVGVSLALKREGLWGLSLLAVDAEYQALGLGGELLERALAHGKDCRGWMTVSSTHPAAMRSYALAGLHLRPTLWAVGVPRAVRSADSAARDGTMRDLEMAAEVDRIVRGASHAADLAFMMENGARLLVLDGPGERGYAVESDGTIFLLAATHLSVAADLLRACLARASGRRVEVQWISADQSWAVPVVLAAGLALEPAGCVCVKGEVGPLTPYLPSGAFL